MRIAWLSYLHAHALSGGGELHQRAVIDAGRERGHTITQSAFLTYRPQRAFRRTGLFHGVRVDWKADLFVVADMRNCPQLRQRFPAAVFHRALETGRAVVLQTAYVDVCPFDMPCRGDPTRCRPDCDRSWSQQLYGRALAAIFVSPFHADLIKNVLSPHVPRSILMRPIVDVERFRPMSRERDIDILYVGSISQPKGYYNLLSTFGADRLTLVGKNLLQEPIQGKYLGYVQRRDLPALYNRARFFAHLPVWYEPMGLAVVEAALCGCQVITNDRVGVTTYPEPDWRNPSVVARNADRFWKDLQAIAELT